jgi:uncharacterized protein
MNKQLVIQTLEQHFAELQHRHGVKSLQLFGSVARNEATASSDVDILVDFGKAPSFKDYMGTMLYLEDALGCTVDLVTKGSLKDELVPYVERDLVSIHAA